MLYWSSVYRPQRLLVFFILVCINMKWVVICHKIKIPNLMIHNLLGVFNQLQFINWYKWPQGKMKANTWCSIHELCLSEDACHSFEILLGDDLRVRTVWKLRCLWWLGQHLFHIQLKNQRGQCESEPRVARAYRSAIFLLQLWGFCYCTKWNSLTLRCIVNCEIVLLVTG